MSLKVSVTEHFLEFFEKTTGSKMKTKRYEVQWQPITAYLCAQKCKEESSFVCTSFDYFKVSVEPSNAKQ